MVSNDVAKSLNDFVLVSLLQTLSENLSIGQHAIINILIFLCKCNHCDFNYDVFSSNFIVHIVALKMD